jgi:uncharacterized protein YlxP (DUF503 family)
MLHIGVLQFTMEIPHARSLKDKRSVVRRLRDRLRRHFNISVAECADLDDVSIATLGAVMAGSDIPYINGALDKLIAVLEDDRDATLAEHQLEIFTPQQ